MNWSPEDFESKLQVRLRNGFLSSLYILITVPAKCFITGYEVSLCKDRLIYKHLFT